MIGDQASGHSPQTRIPIVDFAHWKSDSPPEQRLKVAKDLVSACRSVGFVYIINHGVRKETLDKAFEITKQLYDLAPEEKMEAAHPPGWAHHRGYSWPGLEKVSAALSEKDDQKRAKQLREITDCKESYEIGSDENPDQPNIWLPAAVLPEFRPFMTSFYWTCFEGASKILRALALGIGLDEDRLLKFHSGHYNQLRLLHYPPIPARVIEEDKMARMPAHTDWSSMTMLFQDDCGGLQVEDPNVPGKFVGVDPVEGALVMNVGDLLMRWSNGRRRRAAQSILADSLPDYLRSTSHRVTLPPLQDRFTGDERLTRARYSIPYFVTTDPDLVIECLPSCIGDKNGAKYEPITQRDYSNMRARMQY